MIINSLENFKKIARKLSNKIIKSNWIFLFGEIGVGKTTFTRFLINQIQKKHNLKRTEVPSPTFNILLEYKIKNLIIEHYDFYRLKNLKQVRDLGVFYNSSVKIIEWPELIKGQVKDRIEIHLKYLEEKNHRDITIKGYGKHKKKFDVI